MKGNWKYLDTSYIYMRFLKKNRNWCMQRWDPWHLTRSALQTFQTKMSIPWHLTTNVDINQGISTSPGSQTCDGIEFNTGLSKNFLNAISSKHETSIQCSKINCSSSEKRILSMYLKDAKHVRTSPTFDTALDPTKLHWKPLWTWRTQTLFASIQELGPIPKQAKKEGYQNDIVLRAVFWIDVFPILAF